MGYENNYELSCDSKKSNSLVKSWKDRAGKVFNKIHYYIRIEDQMLRVRAFFHKTVRVCHVYSNFKIGLTRRITVIFGTLKDGSLLINTLPSNICFSYSNVFQNGVDALSKIADAFLSKSSKFYLVWIIRQCSNFASLEAVAQTLIKELQMTFQTSDVSICNGNMKYPIETSTFHT